MIETPGLSQGSEQDVTELKNELKSFKRLSQS